MGYVLAFLTIFIWSINIILAKYFSTSLSPLQIAWGRWLVALIIILPFTIKNLIKQRKILLQHWKSIAYLGIFGIVLSNTLIYKAAETITPINMGLLQISFPLFLTFLSVFLLKVKLSWLQIGGILTAIFGVLFVLVQGDFSNLLGIDIHIGDLYMLINSLTFAIYSFLQSKKPKEVSSTTLLSASIIIGVLILTPLTLFTEGFPKAEASNIELFLYLGIFNSLVAFSMWNYSLGKIGNIKAGMFYYLMPIFSAILGFLIFHEKIVFFEVLGGILIILGLILVNIKPRKTMESK